MTKIANTPTARQFLKPKESAPFRELCESHGIKVTPRQYRKYLRHRGAAYQAEKERSPCV